jgi:hypothetical protein
MVASPHTVATTTLFDCVVVAGNFKALSRDHDECTDYLYEIITAYFRTLCPPLALPRIITDDDLAEPVIESELEPTALSTSLLQRTMTTADVSFGLLPSEPPRPLP